MKFVVSLLLSFVFVGAFAQNASKPYFGVDSWAINKTHDFALENLQGTLKKQTNKEQHALNAVSSLLMSGIFFFGGKYFYDKETEAINNPLTTGVHNQRNFGIAKKTSYGLSIGFAGLSGYQFGRFLAKKK